MNPLTKKKHAYEIEEQILDAAGLPIDSRGVVWEINHPSEYRWLDWSRYSSLSEPILEATVAFVRSVIESRSARSAHNTFRHLQIILGTKSLQTAMDQGTTIPLAIFSELLERNRNDNYLTHYVRKWYRWCSLHGFAQFSGDVAFMARNIRVGGNEKGRAVLSADPNRGPLTDLEITCLLNSMKAARTRGTLTLEEQAALWLCVAFGSNPQQLALLREKDVEFIGSGPSGHIVGHADRPGIETAVNGRPRRQAGRSRGSLSPRRKRVGPLDETRFVQIRIPRMKKGDVSLRSAYRTRRLTSDIGDIIEDLVVLNASHRPAEMDSHPGIEMPLFISRRPQWAMIGTPLEEYALHMSSNEFSALVGKAIIKLNVRSHRTGEALVLSPRRFRYTFASRLVREGVSKREVADLLDHTDLQNVQVYFDIKSDIVPKLDKAMAMQLGPIAQAFMGKLVPRETVAERGKDPASRIAFLDKESASIKPIGTCGSYGFCRLMAPVACYTCASFQPWMDGPHHLLLHDLLKDRERKVASGKDGRMVTMLDDVILAVADVIDRIHSVKAEATS